MLVTVSDKKIQVEDNGLVGSYEPELKSVSDYAPFGMGMVGRKWQVGDYRYGFNGQEKSTEIDPNGNSMTAEFWQYDARIGRRWNVDPVYQHSPYSTFGNSPISVIDPNGADTINITRTSRREIAPTRRGGLDNYPATKILDKITYTGDISIIAAEGQDVFRITDVDITIGLDGIETRSSKTTTLELNNARSAYRTGGHNMKGYIDDRYALAANTPTWLLKMYEKKTGDIGIRSAIAYQKDVPFAAGLNKVMSAAYAVFGVTGMIRGVLAMESAGIAYTTVGRWMSKAELEAMNKTGLIQEGAGGQTFVATGGSKSFTTAAEGSVYVEFEVPTTSLLQGGKDGWFKIIGPNASKSMKYQLNKQGGEFLPKFKNLSSILDSK